MPRTLRVDLTPPEGGRMDLTPVLDVPVDRPLDERARHRLDATMPEASKFVAEMLRYGSTHIAWDFLPWRWGRPDYYRIVTYLPTLLPSPVRYELTLWAIRAMGAFAVEWATQPNAHGEWECVTWLWAPAGSAKGVAEHPLPATPSSQPTTPVTSDLFLPAKGEEHASRLRI